MPKITEFAASAILEISTVPIICDSYANSIGCSIFSCNLGLSYPRAYLGGQSNGSNLQINASTIKAET